MGLRWGGKIKEGLVGERTKELFVEDRGQPTHHFGSDGHIVEHAEAHCAVRFGVVPRRPNDRKAISCLSIEASHHRRHACVNSIIAITAPSLE